MWPLWLATSVLHNGKYISAMNCQFEDYIMSRGEWPLWSYLRECELGSTELQRKCSVAKGFLYIGCFSTENRMATLVHWSWTNISSSDFGPKNCINFIHLILRVSEQFSDHAILTLLIMSEYCSIKQDELHTHLLI